MTMSQAGAYGVSVQPGGAGSWPLPTPQGPLGK